MASAQGFKSFVLTQDMVYPLPEGINLGPNPLHFRSICVIPVFYRSVTDLPHCSPVPCSFPPSSPLHPIWICDFGFWYISMMWRISMMLRTFCVPFTNFVDFLVKALPSTPSLLFESTIEQSQLRHQNTLLWETKNSAKICYFLRPIFLEGP